MATNTASAAQANRKSKPAPASKRAAKPAPARPVKAELARERFKPSSVTSDRQASFTVPTLSTGDAKQIAAALQDRLYSLIDLTMTLRHIHWNVVGPHFMSVHQMLDPQYEGVAEMADVVAERIATLGASPSGVPGKLVEARSWDDYSLDRSDSIAHLAALDLVYTGVITDHRAAIDAVGGLDPMSEDILIGQTRELEKYQWFVRSHLADWAGGMANAGEADEVGAARAAMLRTAH